jgi:bifunctional DNase/RNase
VGEEDSHIELNVLGVYKSALGKSGVDVLVLSDENGDRILPIVVGESEATSIRLALSKKKTKRPMAHELALSLIRRFGAAVDKVRIDGMLNEIYTGSIFLVTRAQKRVRIDGRPSDLVAIALRKGARIYLDSSLESQLLPREDIGF